MEEREGISTTAALFPKDTALHDQCCVLAPLPLLGDPSSTDPRETLVATEASYSSLFIPLHIFFSRQGLINNTSVNNVES